MQLESVGVRYLVNEYLSVQPVVGHLEARPRSRYLVVVCYVSISQA